MNIVKKAIIATAAAGALSGVAAPAAFAYEAHYTEVTRPSQAECEQVGDDWYSSYERECRNLTTPNDDGPVWGLYIYF